MAPFRTLSIPCKQILSCSQTKTWGWVKSSTWIKKGKGCSFAGNADLKWWWWITFHSNRRVLSMKIIAAFLTMLGPKHLQSVPLKWSLILRLQSNLKTDSPLKGYRLTISMLEPIYCPRENTTFDQSLREQGVKGSCRVVRKGRKLKSHAF